jgi:CRP-like cAMP-binding protein
LRRGRPPGRSTRLAASPERLDVLDVLPPDELSEMIQQAAICGFRPGEVLFHEGDPSGGVYFIRRGVARVTLKGTDGDGEVLVGYAGPGETIGEMSAIDGSPRSASVIAIEPIEASYISRDAFREAIRRTPQAAMRLLALLVRRLRAVDARVAGIKEPVDEETSPPESRPLPELDDWAARRPDAAETAVEKPA